MISERVMQLSKDSWLGGQVLPGRAVHRGPSSLGKCHRAAVPGPTPSPSPLPMDPPPPRPGSMAPGPRAWGVARLGCGSPSPDPPGRQENRVPAASPASGPITTLLGHLRPSLCLSVSARLWPRPSGTRLDSSPGHRGEGKPPEAVVTSDPPEAVAPGFDVQASFGARVAAAAAGNPLHPPSHPRSL